MEKHPWEKTTLNEDVATFVKDFFLPPSERSKPGWFVDKPNPAAAKPAPAPETPGASDPGMLDRIKQTAVDAGNAVSDFYGDLSTPGKAAFFGVPIALAGAAYYLNKRRQQNNANSAAGYNAQQY